MLINIREIKSLSRPLCSTENKSRAAFLISSSMLFEESGCNLRSGIWIIFTRANGEMKLTAKKC
uniref:Uncharacterized protein n=1 Tax=Romanomermis culicivorax TaxID=13658 RepID=A0A915L7Z2_ROMCU